MRLTFYVLLLATIQSLAVDSYAQATKLNLNLNNTTVKQVLSEIEDVSEFYFLYNSKIVDVERKVDVNFKNKKINEALDLLFKETGVSYNIVDRQIVLSSEGSSVLKSVSVQQNSISGTVADEAGLPLPGVTVVIKGTTNGTVTNMDGNYSISNIPVGATLQFSFVGMLSQEMVVGSQTTINVVMASDTKSIDEVIVVGFGTQKKSHLTAAIDQIGGDVLENRPLRSLSDGLKGMVAGLNISAPSGAPEAGLNLNIRGFTGFGSSGSPLILVDGIERNINDINPNDVASVTVLKDGASSAIYGSRAPFGVVLITTKKGIKGEKMSIKYSANFSYGTPSGIPNHLPSNEWAGYINEAFRNNPGGGGSPFFSEELIAQMKAFAEGDFNNAVFDGIDPAHVPYGVTELNATQWGGHQQVFGNTNWLDVALKDVVPSQKHNVSVSGGSDKTSYYVGLGYNESVGIFEGPNYKNRYSVLTKIDTEITNWLDFNISANYVRTDEEGPNIYGQGRNYNTIFDGFARSFPNWVLFNPNGSDYRFSNMGGLTGAAGSEAVLRNDITLSGGVVIEPVKDFNIEGNYTFRNNGSNYNRTTLQIMQVLPNGTLTPNQRTVGNTSINKNFSNYDYHTIDLHASYSKTIKNVHNFYGLAGYQEEEAFYNQLQGEATNFYSDAITTLSTSSENFKASDQLYDWATRGLFGRLSYNYDEKYFIEFNIRHDATSRFRKEDRWATFPSVSGAWNVARENFWAFKDIVSQFKLRGSWSTSGNGNVGGYYPFYPTINTSISNAIILDGKFVSTASLPPLVSNSLTWAKPTTIDFGFDMNAFKNRLEINYDWYQRTVKDQFGPANPLPETLGTGVPQTNNAVSETRGWEVNLKWKDKAFNLLGKPFRYDVSFRMSDYIGYVVDYKDNGTGAVGGQWTNGEVFGQNYVYASNGIAQNLQDLYSAVPSGGTWYYPGDITRKDINGDGEINGGTTGTWYSRGDLIKNGFNYPRKRYGISLGAEWNNFDLNVELEGIGQWKVNSQSQYVWGTQGSQWFAPYFQEHADLGYWTPDNTEAFYPRNTLNGKNRGSTDQYTLDLSNLRIRNLKLGYNLPKTLVNKIKLDKVYLYASAENLGFIYYNSFIKYDPELVGASGGQGYPPQRNMSFGINVQF